MKKWNRAWKIGRIEERNPDCADLLETLVCNPRKCAPAFAGALRV
jgi:hypothetical protein